MKKFLLSQQHPLKWCTLKSTGRIINLVNILIVPSDNKVEGIQTDILDNVDIFIIIDISFNYLPPNNMYLLHFKI